MIEDIKALESKARLLEPLRAQRNKWNEAIQVHVDEFLEGFNQKFSFVRSENLGAGIRDFPIPEEGISMEEVLSCLKENVEKPNINPASGGHLGYIPGGGVFTTALGDYLAAACNHFVGIFAACPGGVRMENLLLRWMCDMVGYPAQSLGTLTSGGSIATLSAIISARDFKALKARDFEKCVIYLTDHLHHCTQKSLRLAGLREAIIRYIPVDENYKMKSDVLAQQIESDKKEHLIPFMVFASAGTTNIGTVDPLMEIGKIAKSEDLWFHVDAAYGGFFMLSPLYKSKFTGIELADSITVDPHKGLFLSYGLGAILVKNVKALYASHHYTANYMQDANAFREELSPTDLSPELSRHFRGLRMWISLQLLGVAPFRAALEEKILLCRFFYKKIQEHGFEVGPYPDLSIAIFRYIPGKGDANAFNAALVEQVKDDGRFYLSTTTIDGVFWIRFAIVSFRTHLKEVEDAIVLLRKLVEGF